jgi:hypothetical protein
MRGKTPRLNNNPYEPRRGRRLVPQATRRKRKAFTNTCDPIPVEKYEITDIKV